MLEHLDSGAVRRWVADALTGLAEHRDEIDRLNVYPVPDSDTGTNMYLTLEAAVDAADDVPAQAGLGPLSDAVARGALLGARGNSGIILSQLLRGCADVFGEHPDGGPVAVRRALRRAADQAYAAVSRPVEGTMLTVARAAAEGAQGASLREVVEGAVGAARSALARTTGQLEVLARAGVVDAGGKGVVVVLESLWATVEGLRRPGTTVIETTSVIDRPRRTESDAAARGADLDPGGPAYEVMYLVDGGAGVGDAGGERASASTGAILRAALDGIGDSVVVVGGPELWNIHVHTDRVEEAVRVGQDRGVVRRLRVTSFAAQGRPHDVGAQGPGGPAVPAVPAKAATTLEVVVLGCAGLAGVLADHGARTVLAPSGAAASGSEVVGWDAAGLAEDIGLAVVAVSGDCVLVVPDQPDALGAVRAALASPALAGWSVDWPGQSRGSVGSMPGVPGRTVSVLPVTSMIQALAAVAVHDPSAPAREVLDRMRAAVAATRCGAVVAGPSAGRVIGLAGSRTVAQTRSVTTALQAVLDAMVGPDDELVTLVTGDLVRDRAATLERTLSRVVRRRHPHLELVLVDGRLPGVLLEVGVE